MDVTLTAKTNRQILLSISASDLLRRREKIKWSDDLDSVASPKSKVSEFWIIWILKGLWISNTRRRNLWLAFLLLLVPVVKLPTPPSEFFPSRETGIDEMLRSYGRFARQTKRLRTAFGAFQMLRFAESLVNCHQANMRSHLSGDFCHKFSPAKVLPTRRRQWLQKLLLSRLHFTAFRPFCLLSPLAFLSIKPFRFGLYSKDSINWLVSFKTRKEFFAQ